MNISIVWRLRRALGMRILGSGLTALSMAMVLSTGCDNTADGARCDIALSHDECANGPGSQCVVPMGCADAYCCAVTFSAQGTSCPDGTANCGMLGSGNVVPITSTVASCMPCATPDSGDDGATDAAPAPDSSTTSESSAGPEASPPESGSDSPAG